MTGMTALLISINIHETDGVTLRLELPIGERIAGTRVRIWTSDDGWRNSGSTLYGDRNGSTGLGGDSGSTKPI